MRTLTMINIFPHMHAYTVKEMIALYEQMTDNVLETSFRNLVCIMLHADQVIDWCQEKQGQRKYDGDNNVDDDDDEKEQDMQ